MSLHKLFAIFVILVWAMPSLPAEATVLKIATISPDGSSWMIKMRQGAKEVEQLTEGRVKFKFYPGGVMGSDNVVLRKIRLGQLQGGAVPGGSLAKYAPNSQIYNLPLLFRSFREVDFVRERMDPLVVEALEEGGFVTFGLGEGGFAYLMSNARVTRVAQLKSKKVWVPDSDPNSLNTVEAFGLSPIPLPLGDVLPSLQTGMINTVATSPIAAIALHWHTQVTHMTDMPILYFYAVLAIDKKAFLRISSKDQITVRSVMGRVFKDIDQQNRRDNLAAFVALKNQGIQLSQPTDEEVADWRNKAQVVTEQLLQSGAVSRQLYRQLATYLEACRSQQARLQEGK